ncbi:hypothetical protein H4R26_003232, partial [Coemansia thaxteri]
SHFSSNGANEPQRTPDTYVETAKGQLRDYRKWRRHFTWKQEQVTQTLREYALWSILGLLAYYNLCKREDGQEYEASAFVLVDDIEERISARDPFNQLLAGTTRERLSPGSQDLSALNNDNAVDTRTKVASSSDKPSVFF